VVDAKAHRGRAITRRAPAAGARVAALPIALAARAAALEGGAERSQRREGVRVMCRACALVLDRTIPVETEELQRTQDRSSGASQLARAVEILHPHEPLAAAAARVRVAAERSDERSEMQGSGGGGREAPDALRR